MSLVRRWRAIAAAYSRKIQKVLPPTGASALLFSTASGLKNRFQSNYVMAATDPISEYDPTQPETFDSVHATFADLRARCPVAHSTQFDGFWALACYEDVVNVLRDPDM